MRYSGHFALRRGILNYHLRIAGLSRGKDAAATRQWVSLSVLLYRAELLLILVLIL